MATNKDIIVKFLEACKWVFILWVVYQIITFVSMIAGFSPIQDSTIVGNLLFGNSGVTLIE